MARKHHQDALGITGAETIIGSGVTVHGNLESDADIIIDGKLDGKIVTSGDVVIGVNARINGPINGANINVSGRVNGNINARDVASIRETGQIEGDITAANLVISPGGIFIGQSKLASVNRPNGESKS